MQSPNCIEAEANVETKPSEFFMQSGILAAGCELELKRMDHLRVGW